MQKNDDVKIYIPRTSSAEKTVYEADESDDVRLYPSVSEKSL